MCVHRATAGGALARGMTEALALSWAVLTDHERGAPASDAKHQPQGAQGARRDPALILLTVLEPLREQATLLRMALFAQHHIGHHHALLVHHHHRLAREGGRPGAAPGLEAMRGGGQMMAIKPLDLLAGPPPWGAGPQGLDHRLRECGGVAHQGCGDPGFDAIERGGQGGGRPPMASLLA